MSRPTRSLRPSLDPLEAKTLLSSGTVGHAAGHQAALIAKPELANFYYIYVQTSGFAATNVTWTLYVNNQFIQSASVGSLGGKSVLVHTTVGAAISSTAKFVFTYNVGIPAGSDTGTATPWTGSGQPPYFQTLTLYNPAGGLGGSNPTQHHHHKHHHHKQHHHDHHHHEHHHNAALEHLVAVRPEYVSH